MGRIILLPLYLCFFISFAFGQKTRVQWNYFDLQDGLSAVEMESILTDKDGFLWIGTENGLNRFDGSEFKVYKNIASDSTSLGNHDISCLIQDQYGKIWIGSQGGYSTYDPEKDHFQNYHRLNGTEEQIDIQATTDIIEANNGQIWRIAQGFGLSKIDSSGNIIETYIPTDSKLKAFGHKPKNMIKVREDPLDSNLMWILTERSICSFNKIENSFHFPITVPFDKATLKLRNYDFEFDSTGNIWIANRGMGLGLFSRNSDRIQWFTYEYAAIKTPFHNMIFSVEIDAKDRIWVVSYKYGLAEFDRNSEEFTFFDYDYSGLNKDDFFIGSTYLKIDASGNIWSNYENGLALISPRNNLVEYDYLMDRFKLKTTISYTDVYDDTTDNRLYIIGSGDGFYVLDKLTNQSFSCFDIEGHSERLSKPASVLKTPTGKIWVSAVSIFVQFGLGGLYEYDIDKNVFRPVPFNGDPDYFTGMDISEIYNDSKGRTWVTAYHNGVFCFDQKQDTCIAYLYDENIWSNGRDALKLNRTNSSIDSFAYFPKATHVDFLVEDQLGRMWISSSNGLIAIEEEKNLFLQIVSEKNSPFHLSVNKLKELAIDSAGILWVGSISGGLHRINTLQLGTDSIRKYTVEDGLQNNDIWWVDVGPKGNIWLGSAAGIDILDPLSSTIKHFNRKDGLFANDIYNICNVNEKETYICHFKNISLVDPDIFLKASIPPRTVITEFKVFNEPKSLDRNISYAEKINLGYKENFISIKYAALSFDNTSKISYRYRLEGLEDAWNEVGQVNTANYNSLKPGDYIFHVASSVNAGDWSPEPRSLHIYIKPPFWATIWFRILALLIITSGLYLLYKFRINQIKRESALEQKFKQQLSEMELKALRSQMNPHFLFNSLNAIKFYMLKRGTDAAVDYLSDFASLVRMILNYSDQQLISLDEDLKALDLYIRIERRRFNEEFDYSLNVDPSVKVQSFNLPPMLLQPYVENAIWHGLMHKKDGHKSLKIDINQKDESLMVKITDNGVGRERAASLKSKTATKRKSMGMKITSDRMQLSRFQNQLQFDTKIHDLVSDSGEPLGTSVEITISKLN